MTHNYIDNIIIYFNINTLNIYYKYNFNTEYIRYFIICIN